MRCISLTALLHNVNKANLKRKLILNFPLENARGEFVSAQLTLFGVFIVMLKTIYSCKQIKVEASDAMSSIIYRIKTQNNRKCLNISCNAGYDDSGLSDVPPKMQ